MILPSRASLPPAQAFLCRREQAAGPTETSGYDIPTEQDDYVLFRRSRASAFRCP